MMKQHPVEALGPHIQWREHSLLNNSQFPEEDLAAAVHVHICLVRTYSHVTCMTGCQNLSAVAVLIVACVMAVPGGLCCCVDTSVSWSRESYHCFCLLLSDCQSALKLMRALN